MMLNLLNKQKIIDIIRKNLESSISVVVADLNGITANMLTELRKKSRVKNVFIHVVRNTLMKKIVTGTNFGCLKNSFVNSNLLACSTQNPSDAAKILKEFAKDNEKFQIKFAFFEGQIITGSNIDKLSNLPTYTEAIIKLIFIIKYMTIGRFIQVLLLFNKKNKNNNSSSYDSNCLTVV